MRIYATVALWAVVALLVIHSHAHQGVDYCYRYTPSSETCIMR